MIEQICDDIAKRFIELGKKGTEMKHYTYRRVKKLKLEKNGEKNAYNAVKKNLFKVEQC